MCQRDHWKREHKKLCKKVATPSQKSLDTKRRQVMNNLETLLKILMKPVSEGGVYSLPDLLHNGRQSHGNGLAFVFFRLPDELEDCVVQLTLVQKQRSLDLPFKLPVQYIPFPKDGGSFVQPPSDILNKALPSQCESYKKGSLGFPRLLKDWTFWKNVIFVIGQNCYAKYHAMMGCDFCHETG
jgi:hypothetical protein